MEISLADFHSQAALKAKNQAGLNEKSSQSPSRVDWNPGRYLKPRYGIVEQRLELKSIGEMS